MRRPSLQFYPGDWQSNPKLRRCTHGEKGIWLDVLCILHDQDEYGIVRWPLCEIAIAVNCKLPALQRLVDKQVLKGTDSGTCEPFVFTPRHGRKDGNPVTLIERQDGPIWYSSRMVRDEYVRKVRAESEPKGIPKGTVGEGLGVHPTDHPSRARVSSSSSSSSSDPTSSSKETKARRADKPRDARLDHPALKAVIEVKGCYPHKDTWDAVIKILGTEPDVVKMRQCWTAWRLKNYAPGNLGWLTDWYVDGIPGSNNGNHKQSSQQPRSSESGVELKFKSRI